MKYNPSAIRIFKWAQQFSKIQKSNGFNTAVLLLSFLENKNECITVICARYGIPLPSLREKTILHLSSDEGRIEQEPFLSNVEKVAEAQSSELVEARHLFQRLFAEKEPVLGKIFSAWGLHPNQIELFIADESFQNALETLKLQQSGPAASASEGGAGPLQGLLGNNEGSPSSRRGGGVGSATGGIKANPLSQYGRDLVALAREGKLEEFHFREKEVRTLMEILIRRRKSNPLLVGPSGVGKTALVEGFAQMVAKGYLPKQLKGVQIFEIQLGNLVANSALRGEFEQKVMEIIRYCEQNNKTILFIDDIHLLITQNSASGVGELAQLLKPGLSRGDIRCIATTTPKDYARCLQKDPAFIRRFEKVKLEELGEEETLEILQNLAPKLMHHYDVTITKRSLQLAVDLSKRYISNRALPDKAIDLMDMACAHMVVTHPETNDKCVTEEQIVDVVSDLTLIKRTNISKDKETLLATLESKLKGGIIGQDRVIDRLSGIIKLNKRHLEINSNRPDGVFLFVGPTGVGKTALSKKLAEVLLGDEKKLFRIDMSEFMEKHSVSKLIGSPPGYVDSEKEGMLTGFIKENPYCVILLDEIEKAHPDVINIFLQIFDDGRLTDNLGTVVDFSNSTFIMTSNIGSQKYFDGDSAIGFKEEKSGELNRKFLQPPPIEKLIPRIEPLVKKFFSSEFLNRLDEILFFNPLGEESLRKICHQNIEIGKGKFSKIGKKITISDQVVEKALADIDSFNNGAREINRYFEREVFIPLSNFVIENPDLESIQIGVDEGKFTIDPSRE